MEDLYQYLISGAPNQAQIPAIVDQLRNRRSLGELGQLTGDRVLSPFGAGLTKQTDKYAEDLQGIRQSDIDDKRQQGLADQQGKYQDRILDLTAQRDKDNKEWRNKQADAALLRARAALSKAGRRPQLKPMTVPAMNNINDLRQQRDKIAGLKSTFKDSFARIEGFPGGRTLSNTLAKSGYGTENAIAAQDWWRQFDIDYTLPVRNKTFGATLSANEQKAWSDAAAGKEMSGPQIKSILDSLDRFYNKNLTDQANLYSKTFDPEQVDMAAGREHVQDPMQAALDELDDAVAAGDDSAIGEFIEAFGAEALPPYLQEVTGGQ